MNHYIYDLHFNDVLNTERVDEYRRYYRDDFHVRAIAATRGRAHTLAVRFLWDVYGEDNIGLEFTTPVSIRKIGTAWNGAQPECDWPHMFEYGCDEELIWELAE